MRLVVLHVVGADNHADTILQMESVDKTVECGACTAAAYSQLQTSLMERSKSLHHMGEKSNHAGMVVLVEDTAIDLGATPGHGGINTKQLDETVLQRESDNGLALVVGAQREMQRTDSALQTADDKRLGVGQSTVEIQNHQARHFCAAMYCSSRRWTYLPKTSNSMLTTVPGRKLWKLVTL